MQSYRQAFVTVFGVWWRLLLAIVLAIGLFLLLLMIPVWTTPGNDLFFQISLVHPVLLVVFGLLSLVNGLLLVMQGYVQVMKWRMLKVARGSVVADSGKGLASLGSVALSILSASVACTACYSSLLAVFGLGATSIVFEYRYHIAIGALVMGFVALHYTIGAVNGSCESCKIPLPKPSK